MAKHRQNSKQNSIKTMMERLEDRLCLSVAYDFEIVAKTDDNFVGFGSGPSINKDGDVAFVGRSTSGEAIYFKEAKSPPKNISGAQNTDKVFGSSVWLNDEDVVAARRLLRGTTVGTFSIQLFGANSFDIWNSSEVATAGFGTISCLPFFPFTCTESNPDPFDAIVNFASINNKVSKNLLPWSFEGEDSPNMAFAVNDKGNTGFTLVMPDSNQDSGFQKTEFPRNTRLRPAIDDAGRVVVRTGDGSISLVGPDLSAPAAIVASPFDFEDLGSAPGISDDGQIVTFSGELTQNGANSINAKQAGLGLAVLEPGKGVFASVRTNKGTRHVLRVAGPSDGFTSFDGEARVGVNSTQASQRGVTVVSIGTKDGGEGIYTNRLNFFGDRTATFNVNDPKNFSVSPPTLVVEVGDKIFNDVNGNGKIDGKETQLVSGTVQDVNIFDPVNSRDRGDVAFWVSTDTSEAIVRASPNEVVFLDFDPKHSFSNNSGFGADIFSTDLGISASWPGNIADVFMTLASNRSDLNDVGKVESIITSITELVQKGFDKIRVRVLDSNTTTAPTSGRYTRVFIGDGPFGPSSKTHFDTLGIASAVDFFNQDIFTSNNRPLPDIRRDRDTVLVFVDSIFRPSNSLFSDTDVPPPDQTSPGAVVGLRDHSGLNKCPTGSSPACIETDEVVNAIGNTVMHELGHSFGLAHLIDSRNEMVMNAGANVGELRYAQSFSTKDVDLDVPSRCPLLQNVDQNDRGRLAFAAGSKDDSLIPDAPHGDVLKCWSRDKFSMAATITDPLMVSKAILGVIPLGDEHLMPEFIDLGSGNLETLLGTSIDLRQGDQAFVVASTDGGGIDVVVGPEGISTDLSGLDLTSLLSIITANEIRADVFEANGDLMSTPLEVAQETEAGWTKIGEASVDRVDSTQTPPIAIDDLATADVNSSVLIDLLENDLDFDGTIDPTSVELVVQPEHGTITGDSTTGDVTYTPNVGFRGTDTFSYTVQDDEGLVSQEATVTILVGNDNSRPIAIDDEAFTSVNVPVSIQVLNNDSDRDGSLDLTSVSIVTQPGSGQVTVDGTTGGVLYTPDRGFVGLDTFQYGVRDNLGVLSNKATVTVEMVAPNRLLGDMNGDGELNDLDIEAFNLAFDSRRFDFAQFLFVYPDVDPIAAGDINGDGVLNEDDLDPFDILMTSVHLPDRFEPNDTFDIAEDFGTLDNLTETGLTIHVTDNDDFYSFRAARTWLAKFEVHFASEEGDLDLYVYDVNRNLIARAESLTGKEILSVSLVKDETYYVRVVGKDGAVQPNYDLIITDDRQPAIVAIHIPEKAVVGQALNEIRVEFSEAIDSNTVHESAFRVQNVTTGIDVPVELQLSADGKTVLATFSELSAGDYQLIVDAAAVTDVSGTAVGDSPEISPFTIVSASVTWVGANGGSWFDPNNWSTNRIPSETDDVVIDAGTEVVTFNGTAMVRSLYSTQPFRITGGSLTATFVKIEDTFTLAGRSKLVDATVEPTASGEAIVVMGTDVLLDNVALNADMNVKFGQQITVRNGLKLGGTLTLIKRGSPSKEVFDDDTMVVFDGSQTLEGNGQVDFVFDPSNGPVRSNANRLGLRNGGELVIGEGIGIRGTSGIVTDRMLGNSQDGKIINNGHIVSDVGQGLQVEAADLINRGTIGARGNGATMGIGGAKFSNEGRISSSDGGYVDSHPVDWNSSGEIVANTGSKITLRGNRIEILADGVIENNDGKIQLSGFLVNSNRTLDYVQGRLDVNEGGVVFGGVIPEGGVELVVGNAGELNGVTIDGHVRIEGTAAEAKNVTVNGAVDVGAGSKLYFPRRTQELRGNGVVRLFSGGIGVGSPEQMIGTLTVGRDITVEMQSNSDISGGEILNQGTIRGVGDSLQSSIGSSLTNDGTVEVVGEGTLDLLSQVIVNHDVMRVTGDGLLRFREMTSLTNEGLLSAKAGGLLQIRSAPLVNADEGRLENDGGTMELWGTLDNVGRALNFRGTLDVGHKGKIVGGVIPADGQLILKNDSTLDGVTLNGNVLISGSSDIFIENGLTINGEVTITGSVEMPGVQQLLGSGKLLLGEGGIQLDEQLTVGPDMTIEMQGNSDIVRGEILNQGTIRGVGNGLVSSIGSSLTNDGTVEVVGDGYVDLLGQDIINRAVMRATGKGQLRLREMTTLTNEGLLNSSDGGRMEIRSNGGFTNEGELAIGPSSTLAVAGSFSQSELGKIVIGVAASRDSGHLDVGGVASFNGRLDLTFANGFEPPANDAPIVVASYQSHNSTFKDVMGPGFLVEPDYVDKELRIRVTSSWLPGDANRDGLVNFSDFLILSTNFGMSESSWEQGDFDGNRTVDFADFLSLSINFGKSNANGNAQPLRSAASPLDLLFAKADPVDPWW